MTPQEMIEVIQAHIEGKTIQVQWKGGTDGWVLIRNPKWDFAGFDYRVEPQNVVLYGALQFCGSPEYLSADIATPFGSMNGSKDNNIKLTFDPDGKLIGAEVLK